MLGTTFVTKLARKTARICAPYTESSGTTSYLNPYRTFLARTPGCNVSFPMPFRKDGKHSTENREDYDLHRRAEIDRRKAKESESSEC